MMEPKVSVIVPLYNGEKYIEETILSIINQTYKNIEIIVIDDGSSDQSAVITKNLMKQYSNIKYIYQNNQGVSVARNKGMKEASGEFVTFLDSDDFWHTQKIEKQIQQVISSQMKVCYSGHINFYNETSRKEVNHTDFLQGDLTKAFLTHRVLAQTGTWLFNKSILEENAIQFTPGASWGEDIEFIFKVISVTKVCCIPEFLTYYRILSEGNLSSKYTDYHLKTQKEIEVFQRLKEWVIGNKEKIITDNYNELLSIIDTYSFPHIIIDNACIYFKLNTKYSQQTLKEIRDDVKKYTKRIYLKNGKRSVKLYLKYLYVHFKLFNT
ncbi:glycosyltransferase family 2 protein [Bacillus sp. S3]|uniref:glycosyltransferase family 2 protein n=1 Tax=Bacillus sp. S3 TaxID=486398 RepID=UPI001187E20B|nr:glycosyltransferase family 2 protein [Bacillus sp. S3]QCJ45309.1 glycosyltransferase family 2 protein [Bacillus sp. S3]